MTNYLDVEREITITASPEAIAEHVLNFRNWKPWSPWEELDPDLKRTFSGAESGVGAVYEWAGNKKAGEGRMEILDVTPSEINIDLKFIKPFKSDAKTQFHFEPAGDQTKVRWITSTPMSFLFKVMNVVFKFEKSIGADLEKGLEALKKVVEG